MKDELIICEYSSAEHQMVLRFDDDKDLGRQVFVEIHLVPLVWCKRLWHGIKYIFGYKCCYGNFEEMILSPKHARQIYDLYRFLNKPNLEADETMREKDENERLIMSNIATTIEQSKHLLELGLSKETADMCWVKDYTGQWVLITDTQINVRSRLEGMYEYSGFKWQEHIALAPAWSLSALLEVMPETIKSDDTQYYFHLEKSVQYNWHFISYYFDDVDELYELKTTKQYENPITAAFEMVCWLLEQGLIKKGGEQ